VDQGQTNSTSFMSSAWHVGDTVESLEQFRDGVRGDADSCVANTKLGHVSNAMDSDRDLALKGEFERVGDQIQNNLLPHIAIDVDRFPEVGAIYSQAQSSFIGGRTEYAGQFRSEAG